MLLMLLRLFCKNTLTDKFILACRNLSVTGQREVVIRKENQYKGKGKAKGSI